MTETIQTLKEDIAILQEKLRKLEEQDPEMLLLRQGKVDVVDYDGKKYFRIEYTDSFADAYSWYVRRVGEDAIRPVRDVNVYAPLEELYQKEVVKQKDDYPYKKYTPEETAEGLRDAMKQAKEDGVFDEPKTLYEALTNLGYYEDYCDQIVDAVRCWLPKEQSSKGSQNVYVECTVDGFNDCLDKIKSKLK